MTTPSRDPLPGLRQQMAALGIEDAAHRFDSALSLARKRARGRRALLDPVESLALVEHDGVLHFELGADVRLATLRRARRGTGRIGGEQVADFAFERLPPSEIGKYLVQLDEKLSLPPGLRQWKGDRFVPGAEPAATGRVLLLVHGTFSNGDHLLGELKATAPGQEFLKAALAAYDQVLSFEHHTLSASPVLNAFDLARAFAGSRAEVDVVCHSRGGLVARWWLDGLEAAGAARRRVVFVGSPLAGTSLASGPRLRASFDLLANVFRAAAHAAGAISLAAPPIAVLAGLLRVFASLVQAGARLPVADAVVAMIPGLAGQARVGNNLELHRLRMRARPDVERFAVCADFASEEPGWRFWKYFVGLGT
ncbi:MAG TPA: hypothetical protein VK081_00645, partial [Planctomycetota bacterium]|nr:hypothetical protein [Planctomycetota bacterium]